jgi:hypothetical protein
LSLRARPSAAGLSSEQDQERAEGEEEQDGVAQWDRNEESRKRVFIECALFSGSKNQKKRERRCATACHGGGDVVIRVCPRVPLPPALHKALLHPFLFR